MKRKELFAKFADALKTGLPVIIATFPHKYTMTGDIHPDMVHVRLAQLRGTSILLHGDIWSSAIMQKLNWEVGTAINAHISIKKGQTRLENIMDTNGNPMIKIERTENDPIEEVHDTILVDNPPISKLKKLMHSLETPEPHGILFTSKR